MAIGELTPPQDDTASHEMLIEFPDNRLLIDLCGEFDRNLADVEQRMNVQILRRGNQLALLGDADARGAAAELLFGQDQVLVLETGRNAGFAAGTNHALQHLPLSGFDAVLILNNDTSLSDGFIEKLSNQARTRGLHIAGPRIHRYPETEKLWSQGSWSL